LRYSQSGSVKFLVGLSDRSLLLGIYNYFNFKQKC
jgi:hypothetical protein